MSAPSPNDLFMNVWVSRINSEEFTMPGDKDWDGEKMRKYWARVWLECKELSMYLQQFEDLETSVRGMVKADPESVTQEIELDQP